MVLVIIPILLLTKLSGADLGSIYLKRGNWKLSLGIGALLFFAERYTSADVLGAAIIHAAADLFAFIAMLANT